MLKWASVADEPVSCFEILWTDASFVDEDDDDWDLLELDFEPQRVFRLQMRALPFVRSELQVVSPGLVSGAAADLVVSDGTSATNWTGTATVTAASGTLRQTVSVTTGTDPIASPAGVYYQGSTVARFTYAAPSPLNTTDRRYLQTNTRATRLSGLTGEETTQGSRPGRRHRRTRRRPATGWPGSGVRCSSARTRR